ncbi:uncharacterized protein EI90DRAFT_2967369 [Cantharellus anzutake]|uniref:uncharacterized protein n=1 Tax=Cantharellus anzutake TaxID=1750568 RepID=UPI00190794D0|nr:uncharacterized protein EI90DRAFT_2967369 [Cantharellus anzutake]KAF8338912.1 hypothetical protein EI90DRAFT_2967369 [Cantharellus anzutake]
MSLLPHLSFLRIGAPDAVHTLELWLDYVCPFSGIFKNSIVPILAPAVTTGALKGKVKLLLRLQVQPWHGSSTFTHEAALAVGKVVPESFFDYTSVFFKNQEAFFDRAVADLTPTQIREKLVALAGEVPSIDKSKLPAIKDALTYKGSPNGGIDVTNDLKWNIKLGRQNGIHVSPSAVWDGIFVSDVSSGWGAAEWDSFFANNVKV